VNCGTAGFDIDWAAVDSTIINPEAANTTIRIKAGILLILTTNSLEAGLALKASYTGFYTNPSQGSLTNHVEAFASTVFIFQATHYSVRVLGSLMM
jgi:hypothetical protein